MVVKFQISKIGRRFQSNLKPDSPESESLSGGEEEHDEVDAMSTRQLVQSPVNRKRSVDATVDDGNVAKNSDLELSFILNIFPDGYSIVNPPESNVLHQNPVQYFRKFLRPYDRSSESLITTVECGLLPVNFLDDIECKYIDGKVLCEVRDHRKDSSDTGIYDPSTAPFPTITKVSLQMTLDNVVKDLHLVSDSTWEYGDLLEAEARILNAIQPKICIDPTPNFQRLCRKPTSIKLNLDIRGMRLKRLRQSSAPEKSVTGQPDFVNTISTSPKNHAPNASSAASSSVSCQSSYQIGVVNPLHMQDGQMSSRVISDDRSRLNPMALDGNQSINHSINARESVPEISVTGQPDIVNTISTSPKTHAPNAFLASSSSASCQSSYQINVVNPRHMQDDRMSSMVISDNGSWLNPIALDGNQSFNDIIIANESEPERSVTGQPDFLNTISTNPKNHTPNAFIAASSSVSCQPSYQINVVNPQHMQDDQMSSMVISDKGSWLNPIALDGNQYLNDIIIANESEPERSVMGQPDFLNSISTSSKNHTPNAFIAASSSVSCQSSYQNSVGNPRHMQDSMMSSMVISDKGSRLNSIALDGNQSLNYSMNARESIPVQQQPTVQQIINGSLNQYNVKQMPVVTERINRLPQQFTRANFHQAPWNNMSQNPQNNTIKKEFSSEPMGLQLGEGVTFVPVVGGTRSLTSNVNESTQRVQMTGKWRSNSLVRGVAGSSAAYSSAGNRIRRSTPSNSIDLHLRDRFSKIQLLTSRFKLNFKTDKTDIYKPTMTLPSKSLMHVLFYEHLNEHNNGAPKDENETCKMPLSMSLVGGNVNICKTRIIKFVKNECMLPGNRFLLIPKFKTRLILSERQSDGSVAMHYGELDDCDHLAEDILLPTFPNTHSADLFASEFCSQMLRDGYRIEGDRINPKPISTVQSTSGQPYGVFTDTLIQQFLTSISGQLPIGLFNDHDNIPTLTMHPGLSPSPRSQINPMGQNARLGDQMRDLHGQSPVGINRGSPISNAINHRRKHETLLPGGTANVMSTRNRLAERGMNVSGGFGEQSSNISTLQGANQQIHPGSGSGGVSMLGFGINSANTNPMQSNVMAPPRSMSGMNQNQNQNQNWYMNQQQLHFVKQEATSELQAVRFSAQQVGSPSPSFGMIQHQWSSQQMNQRNQASPQISSSVIHPSLSAGNQDGDNPQLSSQTFGSGSTMDYTYM